MSSNISTDNSFSISNLIKKIIDASTKIYDIVENTKLDQTKYLSNKLNTNIYLKREDLQKIKSFKIRGSYYMLSILSKKDKKKKYICMFSRKSCTRCGFICKNIKN